MRLNLNKTGGFNDNETQLHKIFNANETQSQLGELVANETQYQ